jgi:hypothetical protein
MLRKIAFQYKISIYVERGVPEQKPSFSVYIICGSAVPYTRTVRSEWRCPEDLGTNYVVKIRNRRIVPCCHSIGIKHKGQIFGFDNLEIICLKRPMARPLRIEYPGAYYHVMNRGNRREDIFLTDKDCQVFLDGLADSC